MDSNGLNGNWVTALSSIFIAVILVIGVIINPFNKLEEKIEKLDEKVDILFERMERVENFLGIPPLNEIN